MKYYCRKEWVKRQKILHSYGEDENEIANENDLQEELHQRIIDNTVPHNLPSTCANMPTDVDVVVGGKHCKCGSTTHQRISHKDCPLNKQKSGNSHNQGDHHVVDSDDTTSASAASRKRCRCGSATHQRTSHHDCPLKSIAK